ncbi:MAG: hypothetical protein K2K40_07360 [Paramuribaculum sp.]|nr:hypothetical protein [Paramuribaculum sp.]MDE7236239.1 hypothetical protein [Paramuribaculum sp.]
MNKKMFVPAAIAALMGVGGYLGNATATPAEGLSDLQLENAEALADDNEGDNTGSFEYPSGFPYSSTCNVAIGSNWLGTTRCKVEVITCQGGGSGCNSKKCPVHPA